MSNYPSFPKIERVKNLYCTITEKIDGTNGLIHIYENDNYYNTDSIIIRYGSRNKYITENSDNYGFASFFSKHTDKLEKLLVFCNSNSLLIYGEWFGKGIQKNRYNMDDKYFMPFSSFYASNMIEAGIPNIIPPAKLYEGKFSKEILDHIMNLLSHNGSCISPGCMNPEGVVIEFPTYKFRLKETFDKPKWNNNNGSN